MASPDGANAAAERASPPVPTWNVAAVPRLPTSMMLKRPLDEPTSSWLLQPGCHARTNGATHGSESNGRRMLRTSNT